MSDNDFEACAECTDYREGGCALLGCVLTTGCKRCGVPIGDNPVISVLDDGPDAQRGHYHGHCLDQLH